MSDSTAERYRFAFDRSERSFTASEWIAAAWDHFEPPAELLDHALYALSLHDKFREHIAARTLVLEHEEYEKEVGIIGKGTGTYIVPRAFSKIGCPICFRILQMSHRDGWLFPSEAHKHYFCEYTGWKS